MDDSDLSRHPADQVIRELVRTGREAAAAEIAQIIERMATAPFTRQIVAVPAALRNTDYLGEELGHRARSALVHVVWRVVLNRQWAEGTTEQSYTYDLRQAVRDPAARLAVYERRGGYVALIFGANTLPANRLGAQPLPWLCVVYSADRGSIISGYQASSLAEVAIPGDARWLK